MAIYTVGQLAKIIGYSVSTLRRWDRDGTYVARRTKSNRRYYTDEDIQQILRITVNEKQKKTLVYCRVSSPAQKDDLQSQVTALESFATGRGTVFETIQEVGGGMNFSRKKFMAIITGIINGEVGTLVVAHKDRLARFGFELVENLCKQYGCELIVMNQESLSPQQEMVEDLMSIIHTFSCRLYGLRKYKSKKEVLKLVGDEKKPKN